MRSELNHKKIPFQLKEITNFPLNTRRGLILKYHLPPNPNNLEYLKIRFRYVYQEPFSRYINRQQKVSFPMFRKYAKNVVGT